MAQNTAGQDKNILRIKKAVAQVQELFSSEEDIFDFTGETVQEVVEQQAIVKKQKSISRDQLGDVLTKIEDVKGALDNLEENENKPAPTYASVHKQIQENRVTQQPQQDAETLKTIHTLQQKSTFYGNLINEQNAAITQNQTYRTGLLEKEASLNNQLGNYYSSMNASYNPNPASLSPEQNAFKTFANFAEKQYHEFLMKQTERLKLEEQLKMDKLTKEKEELDRVRQKEHFDTEAKIREQQRFELEVADMKLKQELDRQRFELEILKMRREKEALDREIKKENIDAKKVLEEQRLALFAEFEAMRKQEENEKRAKEEEINRQQEAERTKLEMMELEEKRKRIKEDRIKKQEEAIMNGLSRSNMDDDKVEITINMPSEEGEVEKEEPIVEENIPMVYYPFEMTERITKDIKFLEEEYSSNINNVDAVYYIASSEEFYQNLIEDIMQAEISITMEFSKVEAGRLLDSIVDVIKQKATAGIEVKFIFDAKAKVLDFKTTDILKKAGVKLYPISSDDKKKSGGLIGGLFKKKDDEIIGEANFAINQNMVLVDGIVAYFGAAQVSDNISNITDDGMYYKSIGLKIVGNNITSIKDVIEDDIKGLNIAKSATAEQTKKSKQKAKSTDRYNFTSIYDEGENKVGLIKTPGYAVINGTNKPVSKLLIHMINSTRQLLYISLQPEDYTAEVLAALKEAVSRGVCIKVIANRNEVLKEKLLPTGVMIFYYKIGMILGRFIASDFESFVVGGQPVFEKESRKKAERMIYLYNPDYIDLLTTDVITAENDDCQADPANFNQPSYQAFQNLQKG